MIIKLSLSTYMMIEEHTFSLPKVWPNPVPPIHCHLGAHELYIKYGDLCSAKLSSAIVNHQGPQALQFIIIIINLFTASIYMYVCILCDNDNNIEPMIY